MTEVEKQVVVEREPSSNVGTIVAVVVGVIILLMVLMYGLPYLTGSNNSNTGAKIESTGNTGTSTGN